jgi:hypothetical protein
MLNKTVFLEYSRGYLILKLSQKSSLISESKEREREMRFYRQK